MIKTTIFAAIIACVLMIFSCAALCGTIYIPWFVNDVEGEPGVGYDTWLLIKNVHETETITVWVQAYDDSDYLTGAISLGGTSSVFLPGDVQGLYTGNWAGMGFPDDWSGGMGFNYGEDCDKGSIVIWWEGGDGEEQEWIQGWESIERYNETWVIGSSMSVAFTY